MYQNDIFEPCIFGGNYYVFYDTKDNAENHVKELFITILRNISKANGKRMEALKRITNRLDSMVPQTRSFDVELKKHSPEIDSNQNAVAAFLKMVHNNGTFKRTLKTNNQNKFNNANLNISIDINNIKNETNDEHSELKGNTDGHEAELYSRTNNKEQEKNADSIGSKERKESSSKEKVEDHHDINADLTDVDDKISVKVGGKRIDVSVDDIRRHWMQSCTKKAAKVCKQACYSSARNFCSIYSCSRRAKGRLRVECKRSCKDMFQNNRFSDVE